jgi:hypothetical protein
MPTEISLPNAKDPIAEPAAPSERAGKRALALKYAEDGRLATLSAMGDERASLTRNERIKIEKPGPQVWKDIADNYAQNGFDSISEDDLERFKWVGIYQQRPKDGYFMMRLKIAGGHVPSAQLRVVARIARLYADSVADITTRQTFQLHWLTIENVPAVMDELETVGLGVKEGLFGACGDITRNIVSSPLTNRLFPRSQPLLLSRPRVRRPAAQIQNRHLRPPRGRPVRNQRPLFLRSAAKRWPRRLRCHDRWRAFHRAPSGPGPGSVR